MTSTELKLLVAIIDHDQDVLCEIAQDENEDSEIRVIAIRHIADEEILQELRDDSDYSVSCAALSCKLKLEAGAPPWLY